MLTMWLFSNNQTCFLVPEATFILSGDGLLLPDAEQFRVGAYTADDFITHLPKASTVVLVAETERFSPSVLAALPPDIPKLVVFGSSCSEDVRAQIATIDPDVYLFDRLSESTFSEAVVKAQSDKQALLHIQSELKSYTDVAFTAMKSASEMGIVALFAERAQTVMDISRLAKLSLGCLSDLNVEGVFRFGFDADESIYPSESPDAYKALVRDASMSDTRIVSSGRFLVFRFTHVQLLITNAPIEDEERYGRLRDILAPIVSITEARLKTLWVNGLLKEQQANAKMVMMLLEMASNDNRMAVKAIMTELSLSLRDLATGLDLTLDQEAAMLKISDRALDSLENLNEATATVEEHFRSLLEQLDGATDLLNNTEVEEVAAAIEEDDSNIELF